MSTEHAAHPAGGHTAHGSHDDHDDHAGESHPDRRPRHQEHPAHAGNGAAANGTVRMESDTARRMASAASNFLALLTPDQRARTVYPADNEERFNWHFVPKERNGITFKEMDGAQQKLAHALLASGLSREGYGKAVSIMALERILFQIENTTRRFPRDPDLYHVTVFGEPSDAKPWGWRVEGHHVSVNMLVVPGQEGKSSLAVASTPHFFGANPARVPEGFPAAGLRVLAAEEDIARHLLTSLDGALMKRAVIASEAYSDILTRNERRVKPDDPAGVRAADMGADQRHILMDLIEEYVHRMPFDVADTRLNRIAKEGTGHIHFAWAGGEHVGDPHYYRLQGPSFLVEYDNTQNGANHIHSVWRDFMGDWGDDLLADHYKTGH
jgi:hypothetical protein